MGEDDDTANNTGAVYVFTRTSAVWAQQAYLKAGNAGEDDQFGLNVALNSDGDTLAVGAFGEDSNAKGVNADQTEIEAENAGAVYVY